MTETITPPKPAPIRDDRWLVDDAEARRLKALLTLRRSLGSVVKQVEELIALEDRRESRVS